MFLKLFCLDIHIKVLVVHAHINYYLLVYYYYFLRDFNARLELILI